MSKVDRPGVDLVFVWYLLSNKCVKSRIRVSRFGTPVRPLQMRAFPVSWRLADGFVEESTTGKVVLREETARNEEFLEKM